MIRACLFDLGNVLVFFSHERMCAQVGASCGRSAAEARRALLESGLQEEFERGRVTEGEFRRRLEQLLERPLEEETLREAASNIFEINAEVLPVLEAIKRQGMRLVLVSNTSSAHYEFIRRRFDVLQRFDELVLSFRLGALKPEQAMYRAAISAAGCAPQECFYTDDIPHYVACARQLGMEAEVFTGVSALCEQLARRGIGSD